MFTYNPTIADVTGIAGGLDMNETDIQVQMYTDESNPLFAVSISVPKSAFTDGISLRAAFPTYLAAFCTANSVAYPATVRWLCDVQADWGASSGPAQIANKPALAAVATSGQYSDLTGVPVAPQSFQTIISQSGTSAPANLITPINTYAGSPTFTWARTGTGVYTLTASSAVFDTSGKTGAFIQNLANPVNNLVGVVTSSTVVTFTSSSLGIASLLFGATAADSLVSKIMVYVQTYS